MEGSGSDGGPDPVHRFSVDSSGWTGLTAQIMRIAPAVTFASCTTFMWCFWHAGSEASADD